MFVEELPQGRALNAPNDYKEPHLKGFYIQRTSSEKQPIGLGKSNTPHHSKGPTLDEVVFAKQLRVEELPQVHGALSTQNDQEEPMLKGVVIQRTPLK